LLSSYLVPGHWPPASRRPIATVRARVGTPFASCEVGVGAERTVPERSCRGAMTSVFVL